MQIISQAKWLQQTGKKYISISKCIEKKREKDREISQPENIEKQT